MQHIVVLYQVINLPALLTPIPGLVPVESINKIDPRNVVLNILIFLSSVQILAHQSNVTPHNML